MFDYRDPTHTYTVSHILKLVIIYCCAYTLSLVYAAAAQKKNGGTKNTTHQN